MIELLIGSASPASSNAARASNAARNRASERSQLPLMTSDRARSGASPSATVQADGSAGRMAEPTMGGRDPLPVQHGQRAS